MKEHTNQNLGASGADSVFTVGTALQKEQLLRFECCLVERGLLILFSSLYGLQFNGGTWMNHSLG
jgi:hypothetical protein